MYEFVRRLKAKGWTGKEVSERWGVSPRRISQISADPSQKDWDALEGLPDRKAIHDKRYHREDIMEPIKNYTCPECGEQMEPGIFDHDTRPDGTVYAWLQLECNCGHACEIIFAQDDREGE